MTDGVVGVDVDRNCVGFKEHVGIYVVESMESALVGFDVDGTFVEEIGILVGASDMVGDLVGDGTGRAPVTEKIPPHVAKA